MPALSPPDRLPVTPAGLVVCCDGSRWCICLCRAHRGWIIAERTADGLVARWRFRRKRAAEQRRAELVRAG